MLAEQSLKILKTVQQKDIRSNLMDKLLIKATCCKYFLV